MIFEIHFRGPRTFFSQILSIKILDFDHRLPGYLSKKLKALLVLDTYRQGVSYQVEGDLGKLELSSEAKSKEIAARYEIYKSKMERRLAWQKKMDDSKNLTVDKSVNESTKVSFLNSLILEAELNLKVNPEGCMLDLFLLKRRSDPSKCTRYIMQA